MADLTSRRLAQPGLDGELDGARHVANGVSRRHVVTGGCHSLGVRSSARGLAVSRCGGRARPVRLTGRRDNSVSRSVESCLSLSSRRPPRRHVARSHRAQTHDCRLLHQHSAKGVRTCLRSSMAVGGLRSTCRDLEAQSVLRRLSAFTRTHTVLPHTLGWRRTQRYRVVAAQGVVFPLPRGEACV